jgi:NADPH-dependent F420 reductase
MGRVAIVGGTGPEGLGLGLRFALCGEEVRIGSRQASRAAAAVEEARKQLQAVQCEAKISGAENSLAVEGAEVVVLAIPYAGVADLLPQLAPRLAGKLVIEVINPLVRKDGSFRSADVPAGSAGEEIRDLLPEAMVVSAFKNESAEELRSLREPLYGDVVVCGDDAAARARVVDLVGRMRNLRAVDAGAMINARSVEALTALLLNLNKRHRAITSIQILGLGKSHP